MWPHHLRYHELHGGSPGNGITAKELSDEPLATEEEFLADFVDKDEPPANPADDSSPAPGIDIGAFDLGSVPEPDEPSFDLPAMHEPRLPKF